MGFVQCIVNPPKGANDSQLARQFWSPRAASFSTIARPPVTPAKAGVSRFGASGLNEETPAFAEVTENLG